jgi:hypothetical protein
MKSKPRVVAALLTLLLAGGCIVGDELTTLTIHPDGSADLVLYRSNLRSTEQGDKARAELGEYQSKFDARTADDFTKIREAGGKVLEALWIRSQAPFTNVIHAQLPNAASLEKYGTSDQTDDSSRIAMRFQRDGARRRLVVEIVIPADKLDSFAVPPADLEQQAQANANGISETRIAVTQGRITAARGFTIAEDKQSALLNVRKAMEMLRQSQGRADLFVEWEVAP